MLVTDFQTLESAFGQSTEAWVWDTGGAQALTARRVERKGASAVRQETEGNGEGRSGRHPHLQRGESAGFHREFCRKWEKL